MSLEQLFSTSELNLLVPDTTLEFPSETTADEWLSRAKVSKLERKQAFFGQQLFFAPAAYLPSPYPQMNSCSRFLCFASSPQHRLYPLIQIIPQNYCWSFCHIYKFRWKPHIYPQHHNLDRTTPHGRQHLDSRRHLGHLVLVLPKQVVALLHTIHPFYRQAPHILRPQLGNKIENMYPPRGLSCWPTYGARIQQKTLLRHSPFFGLKRKRCGLPFTGFR